jgi:hypothetical protein
MLSARAWAMAAASDSGPSVAVGVTGAELLLAGLAAVAQADAVSARTAQKPPKCFFFILFESYNCGMPGFAGAQLLYDMRC